MATANTWLWCKRMELRWNTRFRRPIQSVATIPENLPVPVGRSGLGFGKVAKNQNQGINSWPPGMIGGQFFEAD
jgi:hypothetical protein